jgi:hypothetical protein
MTIDSYEQITKLRLLANTTERKIRSEQIIRELIPWDTRPSIVPAPGTRDIFSWQNREWLVVTDTDQEEVRGSSVPWRAFVKAFTKSYKGEIGLFCCTGQIHHSVVEEAAELNRKSMSTLLIDGGIWEELAADPIDITDLLSYMQVIARSLSTPRAPSVAVAKKWIHDRQEAVENITNVCRRSSASFMRRHQLARHSDLYVRRSLDDDVDMAANALRPSKLRRTVRKRLITDRETGDQRDIEVLRRQPPQIMVIRDISGAGKSTLAAQLGLTQNPHFALVRAAAQQRIDDLGVFSDLAHGRGDYGFEMLRRADRPLLLVVDSLDEAQGERGKHKEVISLLKHLQDLNDAARRRDYLAFPILIVLTVRDEYWDRWLTVVEGRSFIEYKRRISSFSPAQAHEALRKYADVYHFSIQGDPSPQAMDVLSVPFNLHVFAEVSSHYGPIRLDDALTENVIGRYFERKREDIFRRRIPGLTAKTLMQLCSAIAMELIKNPVMRIRNTDILELIRTSIPKSQGNTDDILLALVSERIVVRAETSGAIEYQMSHSRFVEYLIAHRAIEVLRTSKTFSVLNSIMSIVDNAPAISVFRIYDNIRFIAAAEVPGVLPLVEEYYATSHDYMRENLLRLRGDIARGRQTFSHDLGLIVGGFSKADTKILWDAFFVLVAKANNQPDYVLVEAFERAWNAVQDHHSRWRLIPKMADRGALLKESVIKAVLQSEEPKEWEVLLGFCLTEKYKQEAANVLNDFSRALNGDLLGERRGPEWQQARGLLGILLSGAKYTEGEVLEG